MDTIQSETEPTGEYKDAQFLEDYMNSQAIAEDGYADPTRKFKCHKCRLAFTRQSYLTSHNKTLLHRKGEKMTYPMEKYMDPNRPYKCDVCKESFTQKNILLVHYNSVSHLHKLRRSALEKESASATSPGSPEAADKKPYKCNICKVSYSQGSTLDIHMRSVLHQTRASKLQELALTGQVDLSQPLIETPDNQKSLSRKPQHQQQQHNQQQQQQQQQKEEQEHRKILTEMLTSKHNTVAATTAPLSMTSTAASGTESTQSSPTGGVATPATSATVASYLPSLISAAGGGGGGGGGLVSFPMTSLASQIAQPPVLFPHQQVFTCNRCSSMFVSQESLLQHQKLFCYLHQQPGQASPTAALAHTDAGKHPSFVRRTKQSMHKQLLESYGFEIVMQFNEYHQKRRKRQESKEKEEAPPTADKEEAEAKPEEDKKEEDEREDEPGEKKPKLEPETKFSSVWVLKAHREEIHGEIVPIRDVQEYSEVFRSEFEKVLQQHQAESIAAAATAATAMATASEGTPPPETPPAVAAATPTTEQVQQALLAGVDVSQFSPQMFNFGFNFAGFPLNMNMSMLAAMNLHPPLMMPPHMDQLQQSMAVQMGQDYMAAAAAAAQQQQQQQQQQGGSSLLSGSEQKRARTRINDEQLKVLRAHFDINNSPSEEQIIGMSEKTALPPKVIKHWFRNTLFKERQRNKDSPYNFNNPPSTTLNLEEYERTGDINVALSESSKVVAAVDNDVERRRSGDAPTEAGGDAPTEAGGDSKAAAPVAHAETPTSAAVSTATTSAALTPSLVVGSPAASNPLPNCAAATAAVAVAVAQPHAGTPTSSRLTPQTSTPHSAAPAMFSMPASMSPPVSSSPVAATTMPPPAPGANHRSPESMRRANRTRFSDYQIKMLHEYFEQNAYPKDDDLDHLSKLLNLSPRVIVVWFQNARQKARKTYENQPAPDDDDARYKRTPGLNYQCKKCMLVFQRYYELIKHQKTACYRDDMSGGGGGGVDTSYALSTYSESSQGSNGSVDRSIESVVNSPEATGAGATATAVVVKHEDDGNFRCEKCQQTFRRFEQWREHQNVHLMNPSLFAQFALDTPFGQLQNYSLMRPQTKRRAEDVYHNDEDAGDDGQSRDKRLRTTILPEQLDYLYQQYQVDSNPSRKQLESIAHEVRLKKRVVQVWFQNTRARERKGQFRSHHQAIHKRCPFCRALFKARTALESHLATKHADQVSRCEINIDAIPNAEPEAPDRPSFGDFADISRAFAASDGVGGGVPAAMFPVTAAAPEPLQDSMKRFYEDSLKRYLDELSSPSHKKDQELALKITAPKSEGGGATTGGETPLDLSKPIRVATEGGDKTSEVGALLTDTSETSANDSGFRHHGDDHSETLSETVSIGEDSVYGDANPNSPNSSTGSRQAQLKRYRTQMSSLQIKVMKCLFADYKTPTMTECEMLGKEIGLPRRVVQVWFQNARAKEKKNKLAFAKQFGQDLDLNHRPPDECKLCSFKYSHKYTIQDHIFTRKHIDNVVKCVHGQDSDAGGGGG
ncbi:PREDICTED: zinc finger homeobox protein 4-like, partial [Priapulus caudatus]|uniref:Zinc finger homeobox protein 4-like n=1 Tax=Priapulus caudatus TaxID=37621 RepID=A0ABM1F8S9_PRICU